MSIVGGDGDSGSARIDVLCVQEGKPPVTFPFLRAVL